MYHVGENGWTKVWSNDTTDMYYQYYPVNQVVETTSIAEASAAAAAAAATAEA